MLCLGTDGVSEPRDESLLTFFNLLLAHLSLVLCWVGPRQGFDDQVDQAAGLLAWRVLNWTVSLYDHALLLFISQFGSFFHFTKLCIKETYKVSQTNPQALSQ